MKCNKRIGFLAISGLVMAISHAGSAATIESWNLSNVAVPAVNPPDDVTGFSIVYDGAPSDPLSVTNGMIAFTPPEANLPGLTVDNTAYDLGGPSPDRAVGCIRASSGTTCDGDFQSGKRFKERVTGTGPVDLVFDVDPNGVPDPTGDPAVGYQVFHRLVNATGRAATGFTLSLGFGTGAGFVQSVVADGLSFSTDFASGPDKVPAFSQFPFGLFGDATSNPNFTLDGFFDNARAGLDVATTEDTISSTGYYGSYAAQFGHWLSADLVPQGGFWDNDGDSSTDAILMTWFDADIGQWEVRRAVDSSDPTKAVSLTTPAFFATLTEAEAYLGNISLDQGLIDDLANLNLNYAISLPGDTAGFDQFTLRVEIAAVPLPVTLPLLGSGLAAMAMLRRRRPAKTVLAA